MPEANGGTVVVDETELQLAQTEPATLLTVQALLERARAGDDAVFPELRALLDEDPLLWREVGDMAHQAEQIWIELVAGPDLLPGSPLYASWPNCGQRSSDQTRRPWRSSWGSGS